jgi:adenylate cyclase class 2
MPEEIEAKVRLASPEAFRRHMAERRAEGGRTVVEVNRLFDDADGTLRRSGSALRLREEHPTDGAAVRRTTLAYKGPRREGPLKRRLEIETTVSSAEAILAILQAVGLAETFRYEKRRTTWHVGECEVALDELPHLGWFVEVEGPTEEAVLARLAEVGLGGEPLIRQTYIELLTEHLVSSGRDSTRAVFD